MKSVFSSLVRQKYNLVLANKFPSENYPPANINQMLQQCEAAGRSDLAEQIKKQWANVLNKYPQTRVNWGAAVTIGNNSLKKNIFGGKEFAVWLKSQGDIAPEIVQEAKKIETLAPPPKGTPAIAIPKKDETPKDWQQEAAKTKEALITAKKAFTDIKQYITFLEKEANDLTRKIADYGEGGAKSTTKTGKSKYADRVPKWEAILKVTLEQLNATKEEIKESESNFKQAVNNYNHAPVTTVAYEKRAQVDISNILDFIKDTGDLDKQRELLTKLNEALGKQKIGASVEEVTAVSDKILSLFEKIKARMSSIKQWLKGLRKSVTNFDKLASIRY